MPTWDDLKNARNPQTNPGNPGQVRNWDDFVKLAGEVAAEEDYPLSVLLGQAAQETGRNVGSAPGHNFFGHKGTGPAGSQLLNTWEDYGQGRVNIKANFKAYNSPKEAIQDYVNLIKRNYPQAYALKDNPEAMIAAIKAGGYATDPNYVQGVMGTPEFQQFRNVPSGTDPLKPTVAEPREATPAAVPTTQTVGGYGGEAGGPGEAPLAGPEPGVTPTPQAMARGAGVGGGISTPPTEPSLYTPAPEAPPGMEHIVKPGETLSGIAQQYLGEPGRYGEIAGYEGTPEQLPIGQRLEVPAAYTSAPPPTPKVGGAPTAAGSPMQQAIQKGREELARILAQGKEGVGKALEGAREGVSKLAGGVVSPAYAAETMPTTPEAGPAPQAMAGGTISSALREKLAGVMSGVSSNVREGVSSAATPISETIKEIVRQPAPGPAPQARTSGGTTYTSSYTPSASYGYTPAPARTTYVPSASYGYTPAPRPAPRYTPSASYGYTPAPKKRTYGGYTGSSGGAGFSGVKWY